MRLVSGNCKKVFQIILLFFISTGFVVQLNARDKSGSDFKLINPGDSLDVLFISRNDLLNLPEKEIVFSFVSEKNNKPTLHGWQKNKKSSGSNEKPEALVKLGYGCVSDAIYQADTNLGNMVLTKKQIKNLQKQVKKAGTEYVIFKPAIENKNVKYEVLLSSEMPTDRSRLPRATSTTIYINPA